jgi:hypothetical protein
MNPIDLQRRVGGAGTPQDWALAYAERVIQGTYGNTVSVWEKKKALNKFGRTVNADAGVRTTVAAFQGAVVNETYVSTNIIDSIVSSSTSDTTQIITIEGHTIDGSGNLTFSVQNATLTGQTEVTLGTPVARVSRMYVKNSTTFDSPYAALVGIVSAYDNTGGMSSGVPTVPAATKCIISAGKTQSEKCATSISSTDYWIVTSIHCGVENAQGPSAAVDFILESRDIANGGVWLPSGVQLSLDTASAPTGSINFNPYRIVPKNHDVRIIAISDAANTFCTAEIEGYLAVIV